MQMITLSERNWTLRFKFSSVQNKPSSRYVYRILYILSTVPEDNFGCSIYYIYTETPYYFFGDEQTL